MTSRGLMSAKYTPTIHANEIARNPTCSRIVQLIMMVISPAPSERVAASMKREYIRGDRRRLVLKLVGVFRWRYVHHGRFRFSLLSVNFWSATVSALAGSHIIILGLVTLTVRMMKRID